MVKMRQLESAKKKAATSLRQRDSHVTATLPRAVIMRPPV